MINILHVTYDMRIGGTEMVIKNIIEGSDSNRFCMSIFCIEDTLGPWGVDLQSKGIEVNSYSRKPGFDWGLIRRLREAIAKQNIHIVHCHQYSPWVYGAIASSLLGVKVIFTEHGRFYPDSTNFKRRLVNPLILKLTDAVTAISNSTRLALNEFEFINLQKVKVIYNGIAPLKSSPMASRKLKKSLGILENEQVIGTISRFDPIKNHKMLLSAFHLLIQKNERVKLLIVGDGEERANIESLIRTLGLKSKVILTGYQKNPTEFLSLMNIFLLPSLSEGTSMTLLEAMSLGKPCVVTDAGGNSEIVIDDETGKVTSNDVALEFSQAISTLLESPSLMKKMGENASLKFANSFNESVMNKRYGELYEELVC